MHSLQERLLAGYTKAKLEKFNDDLNPSLAMVTDWIISSGNTPLSVDMMIGSLDLMQRDDIIEVIQKGRGKDDITEVMQKGRSGVYPHIELVLARFINVYQFFSRDSYRDRVCKNRDIAQ